MKFTVILINNETKEETKYQGNQVLLSVSNGKEKKEDLSIEVSNVVVGNYIKLCRAYTTLGAEIHNRFMSKAMKNE